MAVPTQEIIQTNSDLEKIRPYFDVVFYRSCYPEIEGSDTDLLVDYYKYGWVNLRDPSARFSTEYYIQNNDDVREEAINPLYHYISYGVGEKRIISSSKQITDMKDEIIDQVYDALIISNEFDTQFYLKSNEDVASAGIDPIMHYCRYGWKEFRDPSPNFCTSYYLLSNEDVRNAAVNPFVHYLNHGIQEGRSPVRNIHESLEYSDIKADVLGRLSNNENNTYQLSSDEQKLSDFFDENYYLSKYRDVRPFEGTPLEHYCRYGWRELRNPSIKFSTQYYLDNNPDVKALNINPLLHYVLSGRSEGRQAVSPGGYKLEILKNLTPLEAEVKNWLIPNLKSMRMMDAKEIVSIFRKNISKETPSLLISFGHDNYITQSGGVQVCIQREETLSQAAGFTYLNVYPFQPLPRLASSKFDTKVGLILNGIDIGSCSMSSLVIAARHLEAQFDNKFGVIHHLLGHSPEDVSRLLKSFKIDKCIFWLHDFFSICTGYTLQRNNVSFCGAPPIHSNSCNLCRYGGDRPQHLERIGKLFSNFKMHVISPSEVTKDFWVAKSLLGEQSVSVNPHMELDFRTKTAALASDSYPMNIGFIGYPAPHKGWNIYEELAARHINDERYSFFYFGKEDMDVAGVKSIFVNVSATEPKAMVEALMSNKIDLVIHWASWPETFSFSTYEAISAGCFVITNNISGNVAATVIKLNSGVVLNDTDALIEAFESSTAVGWGVDARKRRGALEVTSSYSDLSIQIIKEKLLV